MFDISGHKVKKLPNNNSTVIDIGANVGCFSKKILKDYGSKVIAYEPLKFLCDEYLSPIKVEFNNFTYFSKAVCGKDGVMSFVNFGKEWIDKKNCNPWGAGTLLGYKGDLGDKDCFGNLLTKEILEVETISINNILNNYELIDLLKLDCEGSEIEIFNVVNENLIRKCLQISVEFHAWIGDKYDPPFSIKDVTDIILKMKSFGYNNHVSGNHPDVLFYKENI